MVSITYYKIKQQSTLVAIRYAYLEIKGERLTQFSKVYYFDGYTHSKDNVTIGIELEEFRDLACEHNVLVKLYEEDEPEQVEQLLCA